MTSPDPDLARQFALEVVEKLRAAGHEALWAGGCVRDELLGLPPKDFDVATSATPEQIREIFGRRRTLAIGASFGVITVLGPQEAGQLDVATFRRDATYSDGRHPDSVSFSSAQEDAQRRDFTINGLFYDPLSQKVIDYVGGREDLQRRVIRAIGNPRQRIAEDKLRMLRAIRFAATFGFHIDEPTLAAIQEQAHELVIVSAERIAAEMRRMLSHSSRARAVQLLYDSGLLEVILPEVASLEPNSGGEDRNQPWSRTIAILDLLAAPSFAVGLAALLREMQAGQEAARPLATTVCDRWKLANEERDTVARLLANESLVRQAQAMPWPQLQRVLVGPRVAELLSYAEAIAQALDGDVAQIDFCRSQLALPPEVLNPLPLITGDDLKPLGISPGPAYRQILDAVRDAQLEKQIATKEEALSLVKSIGG